MKKIRLTETELTNIVKRVINEQSIPSCGDGGIKAMNSAFKAGALTKVEFDYGLGAAYVTDKNGAKCAVGLSELKNIFM